MTNFKKSDILINLVLDESGSMWTAAEAVVSGVNEFLNEQIKLKGTTYLTLTLFNSSFNVRYVATDASHLPPFGSSRNAYSPNGMTALLDAVGGSITGTDAWLAKHPAFKGKILNVIWTDGAENSSREFTTEQVNSMISARQEAGQIFQFLGSGPSAWNTANMFKAIPQANFTRLHADNWSYKLGSENLTASVSNLRGGGHYAGVAGNA